jgi:hypothetical protein
MGSHHVSKCNAISRARDWAVHTAALSELLDEQLDTLHLAEREKCRRRQIFMGELDRAHAAAFNGQRRRSHPARSRNQ